MFIKNCVVWKQVKLPSHIEVDHKSLQTYQDKLFGNDLKNDKSYIAKVQ